MENMTDRYYLILYPIIIISIIIFFLHSFLFVLLILKFDKHVTLWFIGIKIAASNNFDLLITMNDKYITSYVRM